MFGRRKVAPPQREIRNAPAASFDPIIAGANYVGCVSGPGEPVYVDGLREPTACFRGNGEAGVCYLFESSVAGSGKLFLFGSFASIWVDGEAGPRAQIPTEMIANRVPHYRAALLDLLNASPGNAMPSAAAGAARIGLSAGTKGSAPH